MTNQEKIERLESKKEEVILSCEMNLITKEMRDEILQGIEEHKQKIMTTEILNSAIEMFEEDYKATLVNLQNELPDLHKMLIEAKENNIIDLHPIIKRGDKGHGYDLYIGIYFGEFKQYVHHLGRVYEGWISSELGYRRNAPIQLVDCESLVPAMQQKYGSYK